VRAASVLADFLARHKKIGIDTSLFIFQIEGNPRYSALVHPVFLWLLKPGSQGVTSTITMLELLVQPYRRGDIDSVNRFYALLSTYPHLEWIEPTLAIADRAARLRAEHNLRTADALQIAAALDAGAGGFISNDLAFRKVGGLKILVMEELIRP
jgi:predicted nucleic acid-binding protein